MPRNQGVHVFQFGRSSLYWKIRDKNESWWASTENAWITRSARWLIELTKEFQYPGDHCKIQHTQKWLSDAKQACTKWTDVSKTCTALSNFKRNRNGLVPEPIAANCLLARNLSRKRCVQIAFQRLSFTNQGGEFTTWIFQYEMALQAEDWSQASAALDTDF